MRARLLAKVSVRGVVAVAALAFFFAPLALRAAGVTARPFENRPMATLPELSQGWDGLEQAAQFFVDRLPLREQAVRADAWVSTELFDTSPAAGRAGEQGPAGLPADEPAIPDAPAAAPPAGDKPVAGKAGWLFLEGEFVRACAAFIPWRAAMARWQRMASIIRRSGRRVVLVFPPDKSTIHPEYLPDSFAQRDCLAAGHDDAWRGDRGRRPIRRCSACAARCSPPSGPGPRGRICARTRTGTRWARRSRCGRSSSISAGPCACATTRSSSAGRGTTATCRTCWAPSRSTTRPRGRSGAGPGPRGCPGARCSCTTPTATRCGARSRAYLRTPALVPWFGTPEGQLIAAIERADTVLLETIEREANYRASDSGLRHAAVPAAAAARTAASARVAVDVATARPPQRHRAGRHVGAHGGDPADLRVLAVGGEDRGAPRDRGAAQGAPSAARPVVRSPTRQYGPSRSRLATSRQPAPASVETVSALRAGVLHRDLPAPGRRQRELRRDGAARAHARRPRGRAPAPGRTSASPPPAASRRSRRLARAVEHGARRPRPREQVAGRRRGPRAGRPRRRRVRRTRAKFAGGRLA